MSFVTYADQRKQEIVCARTGTWYCYTVKATPTGEEKPFYRWALSRSANQQNLYALWKDKNPRGRKFETKYCATREEAVGCARNWLAAHEKTPLESGAE